MGKPQILLTVCRRGAGILSDAGFRPVFSYMKESEKMNWYQNLYLGESFSGKKQSLISSVEAGTSIPGLFLIVLRLDDTRNQLEILPQRQFCKSLPDAETFRIIGASLGKSEAEQLVMKLTEDVYQQTGTADLRAYLLSEE